VLESGDIHERGDVRRVRRQVRARPRRRIANAVADASGSGPTHRPDVRRLPLEMVARGDSYGEVVQQQRGRRSRSASTRTTVMGRAR